ncbi:S41 family peptidase [Sphingomonas sabuli]|uniref:S41 family peptidase n=1 Tax=Sphingomonas sabuli TaxID=2764186 RepID=A0A7G9L0X4_9SPHN|nr:S41 family peptidase [Sphingomonas sabuli]QNM82273.1 S41 family peptidase [Sphingomonas sabuli]
MPLRIEIALFVACAAVPLAAQPTATPVAAARPLAAGAPAEIVAEVVRNVRRAYVHPDRVEAIVKQLETSLASGRYATDSQLVLSERMSADLKASSGNDGHMYISYKPDEAAAMMRPREGSGPPGGAFFDEAMVASNFGITELKVLPGNVRYMNISQWMWNETGQAKAAYEDAMRFLRAGNAMVIDLRNNGGGAAQPVQFVASHFLDPGVKMITFREGPTEVVEAKSAAVPGGRITGKPLYVLVGPRSASASEEFAAHVKNFKLGTLVGETTAGAGNPNSLFAVPHGFVLSLSTGLAIHAVTGTGWEGDGIAPDRRTDLVSALDVAHLDALKTALPSVGPGQRRSIEWAMEALSAETAAPPAAAMLRNFAGRYDGDRQVTERGGALYYRRADTPEQLLVPLGGNRFAIGEKFGPRVEFDAASGLILSSPTSPPRPFARVPA